MFVVTRAGADDRRGGSEGLLEKDGGSMCSIDGRRCIRCSTSGSEFAVCRDSLLVFCTLDNNRLRQS